MGSYFLFITLHSNASFVYNALLEIKGLCYLRKFFSEILHHLLVKTKFNVCNLIPPSGGKKYIEHKKIVIKFSQAGKNTEN